MISISWIFCYDKIHLLLIILNGSLCIIQ